MTRYREGDEAEKRQALEELASLPLPDLQDLNTTPMPDVEWFYTAHELCDLMAQVEDLDLMTVEPGPSVSQPEQWARVAYKGGSEAGVLNLTTWIESQEEVNYCVTMTENNANAPVDDAQFLSAYRALVATLSKP